MRPKRPAECDAVEVESRLALGCRPRELVESPEERRIERPYIVGTLIILEHCAFDWVQVEGEVRRFVRIGAPCERCRQALAAMVGEELVIDRRA